MTKCLLIVRHGQAENLPPTQDARRRLTDRGKADALSVATKIKTLQVLPKLLVSSTANRANETAVIFSNVFQIPEQAIQLRPEIYKATVVTLLKLINSLDDNYSEVAIFGHNPGFSDLVNLLAEDGYYELPTAAAVQITFNTLHWDEISAQTGTIKHFITPN